MSEYQKMVAGQNYDARDTELARMRLNVRRLIREYCASEPEPDGLCPSPRHDLLERIMGRTLGDVFIEPPFRVDYGINITIKGGFFANFGLVVLDCAPVEIGAGCFFGPNVQLLTPVHPLDADRRAAWEEYAKPVTVGANVWLGAGVLVLPGVTIGDGCVIGAGAVVTRDIPAFSLAVGNPCRVVRSLRA